MGSFQMEQLWLQWLGGSVPIHGAITTHCKALSILTDPDIIDIANCTHINRRLSIHGFPGTAIVMVKGVQSTGGMHIGR